MHQMESRVQQPPRPRLEGSVQQQPDAGMQSPKQQPRYELPRVETQPDAEIKSPRVETSELSKVDTTEKETQTTPTRPRSAAVDGTPEGVHRANGMLDTLDHVFFPAMMSLTRKFNTSLPNFGQAVAQTILQAEAAVRVSKNVYNAQFAKPSKNVPRHFGLCHHVSTRVIVCQLVSSCVNSCHHVSTRVIVCQLVSSCVIVCQLVSSCVLYAALMSRVAEPPHSGKIQAIQLELQGLSPFVKVQKSCCTYDDDMFPTGLPCFPVYVVCPCVKRCYLAPHRQRCQECKGCRCRSLYDSRPGSGEILRRVQRRRYQICKRGRQSSAE